MTSEAKARYRAGTWDVIVTRGKLGAIVNWYRRGAEMPIGQHYADTLRRSAVRKGVMVRCDTLSGDHDCATADEVQQALTAADYVEPCAVCEAWLGGQGYRVALDGAEHSVCLDCRDALRSHDMLDAAQPK
jgi:hypothetical protein